jgi:hypothetical protein
VLEDAFFSVDREQLLLREVDPTFGEKRLARSGGDFLNAVDQEGFVCGDDSD